MTTYYFEYSDAVLGTHAVIRDQKHKYLKWIVTNGEIKPPIGLMYLAKKIWKKDTSGSAYIIKDRNGDLGRTISDEELTLLELRSINVKRVIPY